MFSAEYGRVGARQVVTAAAAVASVALPVLLPPRFDGPEQPPNVIQPSTAAFQVWVPIFAASLGYAAHQARPSNRDSAVLRRTGWPLAAAFACTGAWAPLQRTRQDWAAQVALVGFAAGAETARRRVSAHEADPPGLDRADLLAVVPVTGMLAAWGAAAAGVNLAALLPASGLVPRGHPTVAVGDLLVLGLGAAGAAGSVPGAPLTSRTYAGTLLWALGGIALGQRRRSPSAAASAVVAAAVVLWSALRAQSRPTRG